MGISFRMIYDPLVSVKSEFGQNRLAIVAVRMSRQKGFGKSTILEIPNTTITDFVTIQNTAIRKSEIYEIAEYRTIFGSGLGKLPF